jgi:plastocyanin
MMRRPLLSVLACGVLAGAFCVPSLAQGNATVKGKVIFKGNAEDEKFKRETLDTSKDANCAKSKPKIGDWKIVLNKKTNPVTVRNTLVFVKDGLAGKKFEAPKEAVVLDQIGCEYVPHTFGIMAGQPLKVRNDDDTNHNIHFLPKVNQEQNFSQPKKGLEKDITLQAEAPFKVKCDVHPWMGAYIGVFEHPFFSTTNEEGVFELKGLPDGKYTIEAWHAQFGSQTATVEVKSGETKELDFTYEPK